MAGMDCRKRDFLKLALLASTGMLAAAPLLAQDRRLFGVKLPKEILNILPAKPLNIAMSVETIIRLEREADRKGLPSSILERNTGKPIISAETSLYQLVLPRLVALIDRSELLDLGIADEAGGLLAELHATQHELPEALLSLPVGFNLLPDAATPYSSIVPGVDATLPIPTISIPDVVDGEPVETKPPPAVIDAPLLHAKDYTTLKSEYARLFGAAKLRPEYSETAEWHVTMMKKSKSRYASISDDTGVPWYFIAVCHALESSFNFRAHLHNGDFPLSARTRQVPAGRPTRWLPPSDWESSARDALRLLGFAGQKDWSVERTLYRLEAYNGFGYRPYGVASPYLWSFSNHYARGKYVADRKWSATAKSQQCGAAVMLRLLTDAGEIEWPTA
jgi:lysozyme family protein